MFDDHGRELVAGVRDRRHRPKLYALCPPDQPSRDNTGGDAVELLLDPLVALDRGVLAAFRAPQPGPAPDPVVADHTIAIAGSQPTRRRPATRHVRQRLDTEVLAGDVATAGDLNAVDGRG